MNLKNGILTAAILIFLFHPVAGEVTTLSIATDSSWKCLDFENNGWTSNNYDDSWWESAYERRGGVESSRSIWYPGGISQNPVYFRSIFNIDGVKILNGKAYAAVSDGTYGPKGTIYLYINDRGFLFTYSQEVVVKGPRYFRSPDV